VLGFLVAGTMGGVFSKIDHLEAAALKHEKAVPTVALYRWEGFHRLAPDVSR
jgi:hypothetical protein